ncbi:hypothetical protein D3C78_1291180 [compost metagenome]
MGGALHAADDLADLLLEARANLQPLQSLVGRGDPAADRRRRQLGAGLDVLDHEIPVHRHHHAHLVERRVRLDHPVQRPAVVRLHIGDVAFDVDQPILAQVAGTGDLAGVQEGPVGVVVHHCGCLEIRGKRWRPRCLELRSVHRPPCSRMAANGRIRTTLFR